MFKTTPKIAFSSFSTVAAIFSFTGCSNPAVPTTNDDQQVRAGLSLTTDILDDTDIAGMHYTITGVDCDTGVPFDPAQVTEITKDLESLLIPGGNPDLIGNPFDAQSGHLFADAFFTLDAGCYDVQIQPIDEDGNPSEDCASASQSSVEVFDGQTTEILLISQCDNDPVGALDVIAAVNHAPQILDAAYDPSKFTCEDATTICVTVIDPDNDPLTFEWSIEPDSGAVDSMNETVNDDGSVTACATFNLGEPGDYEVSFTAYDMAYDSDNNFVTIEELLVDHGSAASSNDTLTMPIHALDDDACIDDCSCPDGFTPNPTGDLCERITVTSATFNGELNKICNGETNANYGAWGARFPGGTYVTSDPFFGSGFSNTNGTRLQTQDIWACDANGNQSNRPVNEWIGFSRCLDIAEGGAYVVGIAADNFIRAKLNGASIFTIDSGNATNDLHPYRRWHMLPITLTSGSNIVELEAMNVGGPAAFAAEIYGPFDPADLATDASMVALDYANNIVWTTGDQIGGNFDTGTSSGWSCDDGYALDFCSDDPSCTLFEQISCEE